MAVPLPLSVGQRCRDTEDTQARSRQDKLRGEAWGVLAEAGAPGRAVRPAPDSCLSEH